MTSSLVPMTIPVVRAILLAAVLTCVGALASEPPPVTVVAVPARQVELAPTLWVPGGVISRSDARVASDEAGRIERVADVGDRVAAGDVLARLDSAMLALRERELVAELARADAQLDYLQRQEARVQELAARQTVSGAALDEARSSRIALEHDRQRAEVALQTARHRLARAVVRAPFPGVVVERLVQAGEHVQTGTPVVRLVDTADVEVIARAPVALAAHLQPGTRIAVRTDDALLSATVRVVVPVGDQASRQFEVRATLDGAIPAIGSAVEVALPGEAPRSVVAVPRDALVMRRDETWVVRLDDEGRARRVAVRLGSADGEQVEIIGGIAPGDRVVIRGAERIREGQATRSE
jgi:RND family efflux transporter MFP subunit